MNKWYHSAVFIITSTYTAMSQSIHYDSGLSIRNRQPGHYYKMVSWNDEQYEEFAYWEESQYGAVMDFMNWRAIFPPGFDKNDSTTKYPAIVMLHGAGESGRKWSGHYQYEPTDPEYDNNGHQLLWGGQEHLNAVNRSPSHPRAFPGIVIFPQASYNAAWVGDNISMAALIIEYMIREYNVDPYRIAVHGLSNGAKGVWEIAWKRPDLFAAALPMSGVGQSSDMEAITDSLVTTPLWLFQGENDTNPSPGWSVQWIDMLIDKGGNPRYTIYDSTGHGTWNIAYAEPDFFSWILAQDKRDIYVFGDSAYIPTAGNPLQLGFSAGFLAYQWTRDGEDLAGANERYYTATEEGIYTVRFKKRTDSLWAESYELDLSDPNADPDPCSSGTAPSLVATSSTTLPVSTSGSWDKTLDLVASAGHSEYRWYKDDVLITTGTSNILNLNNISGQLFQPSDAGVYTVSVIGSDECPSPPSDPVTVTYTDPQPTENPPMGVTGTPISSSEIEVTWNDTSDELYYELWQYRRNTLTGASPSPPGYPGGKYIFIAFIPANTTFYLDQELRPGAQYGYKVRAIRTNGGTESGGLSFVTTFDDTVPPTAPSNFTADGVTDSEVHLTWTASTDDDVVYKYEIFNEDTKIADVRADTTDSDPTDGSPAPPTSYLLSGLTPGTTYSLQVRAVDYEGYNFDGNYSPFSNTVVVTTDGEAIIQVSGNNRYHAVPHIYPNPFRNKLHIRFSEGAAPPEMALYDMQGNLVSFTEKTLNNEKVLELKDLEEGTYVMSIGHRKFKVVKGKKTP